MAGRSGGTTKTATGQGVVVDFVSQKTVGIRGNPSGLSHSTGHHFSPESVRSRLEVAAVQLPRLLGCELDPDEREAIDPTLRGYVKRDIEAAR